jgi:hypothetical protein
MTLRPVSRQAAPNVVLRPEKCVARDVHLFTTDRALTISVSSLQSQQVTRLYETRTTNKKIN